jgi:hypothetical protein
MQLDLFERREERLPPEYFWKICWGWAGPRVGEYCEVNNLLADLADGTGTIYCYMERCRIIEALPGEQWLAEIDMGEFEPRWGKNGTKLILPKDNIWPSVRDLSGGRHAASRA